MPDSAAVGYDFDSNDAAVKINEQNLIYTIVIDEVVNEILIRIIRKFTVDSRRDEYCR